MLDYFKTLFDYYYWANKRVLDAASAVTEAQFVAPGSYGWGGLRGTLVHIMGTEWIWRSRWNGVSPTKSLQPGDFATVDAVRERWLQEEGEMLKFLAGLNESKLDQRIEYTRMRGGASAQRLWQMMTHVANHGTQHRAEVAVWLTEYGHSPGDVDFIVYVRERA